MFGKRPKYDKQKEAEYLKYMSTKFVNGLMLAETRDYMILKTLLLKLQLKGVPLSDLVIKDDKLYYKGKIDFWDTLDNSLECSDVRLITQSIIDSYPYLQSHHSFKLYKTMAWQPTDEKNPITFVSYYTFKPLENNNTRLYGFNSKKMTTTDVHYDDLDIYGAKPKPKPKEPVVHRFKVFGDTVKPLGQKIEGSCDIYETFILDGSLINNYLIEDGDLRGILTDQLLEKYADKLSKIDIDKIYKFILFIEISDHNQEPGYEIIITDDEIPELIKFREDFLDLVTP